MNNDPNALIAERHRIISEYGRRARDLHPDLYARWQPAELLALNEVRRNAAMMLRKAGVFPRPGDSCLEVGYGTRGWLATMLDWGVRARDLHGIELNAALAGQAQELLPVADLRVGDAAELPWEDNTFRLVIASTVFTSILDLNVRQMVAQEITRVLTPGGALLWYDFVFNNPRNPNVKKVSRKELKQLFPRLNGKIKSVELAPPLARLVAPRSWTLASLLQAIPLLRTHLVAVLVKIP